MTDRTPIIAGGDPIIAAGDPTAAVGDPTAAAGDPISPAQRAVLALVVDMIVPPSADGRMPGAAELGVTDYLLSHAAPALPAILADIDRLQALAGERHGSAFEALPAAARQTLVDGLRAAEPAFLERLALETVTCYYQSDRVLALIGVEARPPFPQGYQVIQGDLSLLAPVRRRGPIYRDV